MRSTISLAAMVLTASLVCSCGGDAPTAQADGPGGSPAGWLARARALAPAPARGLPTRRTRAEMEAIDPDLALRVVAEQVRKPGLPGPQQRDRWAARLETAMRGLALEPVLARATAEQLQLAAAMAVAMLDDGTVIRDDSPSCGGVYRVRSLAVGMLGALAGGSRGRLVTEGGLVPPGARTPPAEEVATLKAWRDWWRDAAGQPRTTWLEGGRVALLKRLGAAADERARRDLVYQLRRHHGVDGVLACLPTPGLSREVCAALVRGLHSPPRSVASMHRLLDLAEQARPQGAAWVADVFAVLETFAHKQRSSRGMPADQAIAAWRAWLDRHGGCMTLRTKRHAIRPWAGHGLELAGYRALLRRARRDDPLLARALPEALMLPAGQVAYFREGAALYAIYRPTNWTSAARWRDGTYAGLNVSHVRLIDWTGDEAPWTRQRRLRGGGVEAYRWAAPGLTLAGVPAGGRELTAKVVADAKLARLHQPNGSRGLFIEGEAIYQVWLTPGEPNPGPRPVTAD